MINFKKKRSEPETDTERGESEAQETQGAQETGEVDEIWVEDGEESGEYDPYYDEPYYEKPKPHILWRLCQVCMVGLLVATTLFWATFIFASTNAGTELLNTLQAYYYSLDNGVLVQESKLELLEPIDHYKSEAGYVEVQRDSGETVRIYNKDILYTDETALFVDSVPLRLAKRTYIGQDGTTRQEWCLFAYEKG